MGNPKKRHNSAKQGRRRRNHIFEPPVVESGGVSHRVPRSSGSYKGRDYKKFV